MMDPFSYLAVLISIILGLGITQLLGGLGRLLQERHSVRLYRPTIVWAGLLLVVLHVQTWWAMFGLRTLSSWSFLAFLLVLLQPVVLFLLAALILPDGGSETSRDLRANYFAHSRWFFGLGVLLLVGSLTRDVITQRELSHRWLAAYSALILIGYIAVLFRALP